MILVGQADRQRHLGLLPGDYLAAATDGATAVAAPQGTDVG
jgi:hypothetical protein